MGVERHVGVTRRGRLWDGRLRRPWRSRTILFRVCAPVLDARPMKSQYAVGQLHERRAGGKRNDGAHGDGIKGRRTPWTDPPAARSSRPRPRPGLIRDGATPSFFSGARAAATMVHPRGLIDAPGERFARDGWGRASLGLLASYRLDPAIGPYHRHEKAAAPRGGGARVVSGRFQQFCPRDREARCRERDRGLTPCRRVCSRSLRANGGGAGRVLLTPVGLGTFVDPGSVAASRAPRTTEDLVAATSEIDGGGDAALAAFPADRRRRSLTGNNCRRGRHLTLENRSRFLGESILSFAPLLATGAGGRVHRAVRGRGPGAWHAETSKNADSCPCAPRRSADSCVRSGSSRHDLTRPAYHPGLLRSWSGAAARFRRSPSAARSPQGG